MDLLTILKKIRDSPNYILETNLLQLLTIILKKKNSALNCALITTNFIKIIQD